ncbi:hotdog domain-containing protein [Sedimentibacter sp.]|uniref:acyl-CoA thioesterase n=1 Tax=Sedimentibacter sp. TaxID=1960295 RepID=UPI0028A1286E|nr:hotdog domain-containing protein [Sedimentibacter sp.]
MKKYICSRLVKSEELNHHGTLFAGRTAEWFVESAFVAAASTLGDPKHVVCLNIHGLLFRSPVDKGDIVTFTSKVVHLGKSSIVVYTKMITELAKTTPVDGFITFISVDCKGNKVVHGLSLDETTDEEELKLREMAKNLNKK